MAQEAVRPEAGSFPRLVRSSSHAGSTGAVAFNGDGSLFATVGGMDQTLKIWSVASKALIRTITIPETPKTVAFVPGKPTVCAVGAGQAVWFYETIEGRLLKTVPVAGPCVVLAFSPDGARMGVVTAADDVAPIAAIPNFHLYATETHARILTRPLVKGHAVLAVARRAGIFAVLATPGTVALLDAETGREVKSIQVSSCENLALNSDASQLAVLAGVVTTFDVATGQQVREFASKYVAPRLPAFPLSGALPPERRRLHLYDVRFSGDDRFVVAGGTAVCIWRLEDGQQQRPLFTGSGRCGLDVCASPALVGSGSSPRRRGDAAQPHLWEVASGRPVDLPMDEQAQVRGLAFSADEARLAVGRGDQLEVWDFATSALLLHESHTEVNAVAFNRNGKEVFSGGDHYKNPGDALQMHHLETLENRILTRWPEELLNERGMPDYLALAGCPATAQIAIGALRGPVLALYDTEQQKFMDLPVKAKAVKAVAFAPDGAFLAFATGQPGYDSEVGLWRSRTAKVTTLWKLPAVERGKEVSCVAVDETGARVAAAADLTVKVWNAATGKDMAVWKFEGSPVKTLVFETATGALLVGKMDGEVLQVGARGERKILVPQGQINGLRAMVLAQKRRLLALGGEDGNLILLQLGGDRPQEVCRLYGSKSSWAVIAPDGRFDTDALEEIKGLHWVFPDDPLRALGVEVFMRDYYEPHLLQRLLAGESLQAVRPLQDLNRAQPRLEVTQIIPWPSGDRVDVEVSLARGVYDLQRGGQPVHMESDVYDVRLLRDGKLVAQFPESAGRTETPPPGNAEADLEQWRQQTLVKTPAGGRRIRFEGVRIPASGHKTVFSAYAFNNQRVKSTDARLEYEVDKEPHEVVRRAHLLCVGVSRYQSPALNLDFAAADARALSAVLQPRLEKAGYCVNVRLLISEQPRPETWQAKRDDMRLALQEIARQAAPEDMVVISFSGHGYADVKSEFYLLPSDVGPDVRPGEKPGAEMLQRCISGEDLSQWIRPVDASEIIVIIDACQAAAAVQQEGFKPAPIGSRGLGQLAFDKRMRVLTATQANDFALEFQSLRQGLLTWALTQDGLESAAADFRPPDGEINLGEWLAWGVKRVPELHQQLRTHGSVTRVVKGVREKANLVILKEAADGSRTRQLVADDDDLKDSSLAKDRPAQSPQLFDFAPKGFRDLILQEVEKPQ
jgi:WD40 repeat protein